MKLLVSGTDVGLLQAFRYLTPKLRLSDNDLTPCLLRSRSFHLICSPTRCIDLVQGILSKLDDLNPYDKQRPFFIWEPVPDLCTKSELQNTIEALNYVDVISPNHDELGALLGIDTNGPDALPQIEQCAKELVKHNIGPTHAGSVIARAGKHGCYIADSHGTNQWLPAYHQSVEKVVDPTGGGNGFLGGLAVGMVRTSDVVEAAMWGNVAASFCIEQVGVPVLSKGEAGKTERWNGVNVEERLQNYRMRVTGKQDR
ncbi:hypothetical protein LTR50_004886 [Elasticomyces elasticus]|nr:hypothetical protein LTR50_004886 [Elasticomyces elasticus]